jgi:hypothetical protein
MQSLWAELFNLLCSSAKPIDTVNENENAFIRVCNKCSIELFIKLAMTVFFKRQQHRKLSWLDKNSDKNQSQFDELFN